MAVAKTVSTKIRKKNWYPLVAPKLFRNAVLGETTVYDEAAMTGKIITSNLMSLTGDIKRQNISIDFEVARVENGRALTEIVGYQMIPASIKRLTRRNSEKIELSFACDTSDGKHIRIKPLVFAISDTKGSVGKRLRKTATDFLIKTIRKTTYDNLIADLVENKLQRALRENLKKIYPIRISEIRAMHIEKEKKHGENEAAEEEAVEKEEVIEKEISEEVKEEEKVVEKEKPKEAEAKPKEEKQFTEKKTEEEQKETSKKTQKKEEQQS